MGLTGLIAVATVAAQPALEPFAFHCSAPLSDSSQLLQSQSGRTYRIRGRLRAGRVETIPDPTRPLPLSAHVLRGAAVTIRRSDYSAYVAIEFSPPYGAGADEGGNGEATGEVSAHVFDDGETVRAVTLGTIRQRGWSWDGFDFDISTEGDQIRVEANGHRAEFALNLGPNAIVELSCQGGDFSFQSPRWAR